ncbi:ATP-binding protein [Bifidobacterium moukalabense]|uniref:Histidine kinase n=2 Tax=Bifidobacterium moukalabense TaxID=1333651 RepID=W4N9U8_9BIFI|nr:ATP-binding protein [Bifidobacterium moukalabense]ETY71827.1 histidine kinase [Bifidobacterium moukalabense DSM 27321]
MFDAGCLDDVSDYDIYSLFGNALDNAIEACEKLADEERRVIKLTGVMRGRLASINIVNYFDELDRNGQGEIITTKSDKTSHGYGLKSIRMIVARLGGDMSVTTENGIFDVSIMLPKS